MSFVGLVGFRVEGSGFWECRDPIQDLQTRNLFKHRHASETKCLSMEALRMKPPRRPPQPPMPELEAVRVLSNFFVKGSPCQILCKSLGVRGVAGLGAFQDDRR